MPPHYVGCPRWLSGRLGYPLPFAMLTLDWVPKLYLVDFLLESSPALAALPGGECALAGTERAIELRFRSRRFRLIFFLVVAVLPWATLPRYFQSAPSGTARSRHAYHQCAPGRRATYGVTGLWVQRLAVEDIRYPPIQVPATLGGVD